MLAPMALAKPERAWYYACITTIASVLGGLFGYITGMFFFKLIHPYIIYVGYAQTFDQIVQWFQTYGFWVMFFAGFAFIPYKIFTIAAGAMGMALIPFTLGSIVGRGGRFFLVTLFMLLGGQRMETALSKNIDRIGWATIILLALGYLIWHIK
jgi:membrane protein YqaA with SNARE-associated domain